MSLMPRSPFHGWLAALWLAAALSIPAGAAVVREIRIETAAGGPPVDEALVRAHLGTRVGQEFDRLRVSQDVKALEKSGRFESVVVRAVPNPPDGVTVVVDVRARARIERLEIEGATWISARKVREWLGVGLGDFVDESKLAAGAARIRDEYRKRYYPDCRVSWTLEPAADPAATVVRVVVREGPHARIRVIEFTGNEQFPAEVLQQQMQQIRYRWYNPLHWFQEKGRLDRDELEADLASVRRYYTDRGYLDARVGDPDIRIQDRNVNITIPVTEGRIYRIGRVRVEGATLFSTNELGRAMTGLRSGEIASLGAIEEAADRISSYYGDRGYLGTDVRREVDPSGQEGVVDLLFRIREGRMAHLQDVRIRGNTITQDRVIRREILVEPGERYNASLLRTSQRRVQNLGYFSTVNAFTESTAREDYYDAVFEVEEQRMGQASAGVGFSSIDQVSGFLELSHGNFDISSWPPVGAGQKARMRAMVGTRRQDIELSFIEPYFLDRRLAFEVDLFRRDKRYLSDDYDERDTGGELSLTRPLGRFFRASIGYGLEQIEIYNLSDDASERIREEEGRTLRSAVTLALTHDSRDRVFVPTRGNLTRLSVALAGGPFAGDVDWHRLDAQTTHYVPLWLGHVLMVRGRAGTIEEFGDSLRVPIYDRYFLGGANTVRAFKYRDMGPRDEEEEPVGGRSMAFASAEYIVPVVKYVRVAAFWDGGMVWEEAYQIEGRWNSGYGVGLRLDIPMLPLRLDYAWPIDTDGFNDDPSGRFSFIIGHGF